jgi:hypothetical protein
MQCIGSGHGGFSSGVTWSASGGSIDASGRFTAPASPGTTTVTATSTQDTTKSGTATVTVQSNRPTITSVAVTLQSLNYRRKRNLAVRCSRARHGNLQFWSGVVGQRRRHRHEWTFYCTGFARHRDRNRNRHRRHNKIRRGSRDRALADNAEHSHRPRDGRKPELCNGGGQHKRLAKSQQPEKQRSPANKLLR